MPHQRAVEVVLAQWREVERRLAETEPGTPDAEWLQGEAVRLRDEYRRAIEAPREEREPPTGGPPRHSQPLKRANRREERPAGGDRVASGSALQGR